MSLPFSMTFKNRFGRVVPFSGNFTLMNEDNGKVFRCDSASNVTVSVARDLRDGFSVGFAQWNTGTITLAANTGATNRAGGSVTSGQYQHGSLIVIKNSDTASAEYVVGGDFS